MRHQGDAGPRIHRARRHPLLLDGGSDDRELTADVRSLRPHLSIDFFLG
jgi:hypothetical protein